jgi:hypothetical protein
VGDTSILYDNKASEAGAGLHTMVGRPVPGSKVAEVTTGVDGRGRFVTVVVVTVFTVVETGPVPTLFRAATDQR